MTIIYVNTTEMIMKIINKLYIKIYILKIIFQTLKFDKLKEYVNNDELVRDDEIDIFACVDNEHSVLIFEFEDNIVNGLIAFKIFAVNGSNERTRRMYFKIVGGDIVEYKGVQEDIVVDGVSIKGLARSEEDSVAYMPTAELIMDTTERLISIPFTNYKLTGAIVEQCTCMRQMIYTPNDIAYLQDIEALNKKIDALAEQSHANDIQTFALEDNLREEFETVDEVNTVFTNYALKNDLPPTIDLSGYRKLNDINYNTCRDLTITRTIINDIEYHYVEYVEGMRIKTSLNFTEKTVNFDFNYHPTNFDETYDCYAQEVIVDGETYIWEYNPSDKSMAVRDSYGNYFDNDVQFEYISDITLSLEISAFFIVLKKSS